MDNAYKSLELYKNIRYGLKTVRVKKLNLGQFIEFMINYKHFAIQDNLRKIPKLFNRGIYRDALNACVKLSTGRTYRSKRLCKFIIEESRKFSRPEGEGKKDVDADLNYLQGIIHTIAWYYKWSKVEVLALYPDEIKIYSEKIAREIRIENIKQNIFMTDLRYIIESPNVEKKNHTKHFLNYQSERKELIESIKNIDNKKIGQFNNLEEFKKSQSEWLKKEGVPLAH